MMALANVLTTFPDTEKVAVIAVIGVLLSALVGYMASRRAIYINSVTVERTKWIESLRINIAKLTTESRLLNYKINLDIQFKRSEAYLDGIRELKGDMNLVRLQLNPDGRIDANVLELVRGLPARAEALNGDDLMIYEDLLIRHCQWLLKAEWEKVKYELSGVFGKYYRWLKAKRLLCRYKRFCAADGAMPGNRAPPDAAV